MDFYRPQTKFAKVMFLQVSVCPQGGLAWLLGGACVVAPGGHAWLLRGAWLLPGGMRGCSRGACVAALGRGAWLLPGGHVWLLWGGMHGCSGGHKWLLGGMRGCSRGACVVARGRAWLLPGGCLVLPGGGGGVRGVFHEIRSMSGRYASYWNTFLFNYPFTCASRLPSPSRTEMTLGNFSDLQFC